VCVGVRCFSISSSANDIFRVVGGCTRTMSRQRSGTFLSISRHGLLDSDSDHLDENKIARKIRFGTRVNNNNNINNKLSSRSHYGDIPSNS